MTKSRSSSKLLTEVQKEEFSQPSDTITQIEEKNNLGVEHEIDCPRCHDVMTLQSEFDRLGYVCEECDFLL